MGRTPVIPAMGSTENPEKKTKNIRLSASFAAKTLFAITVGASASEDLPLQGQVIITSGTGNNTRFCTFSGSLTLTSKVKTVLINPHYCPDNKGENPRSGLLTQASSFPGVSHEILRWRKMLK